ncbi:MAG: hypothetical protein R8N23_04435 [Reichenbachiella sp.]|uniref:hypothetical protein n=1 Tax=Reichenbachiella sp. TaxID=2184521 RepID=UPI002966F0FE|nr:hypothetical protein [Reichenbachiella sp.]MDW3209089.1 hypothetical protein [Reichenbachiella sp.]
MRVICDSNIWYGFVDGTFDLSIIEKHNLCTPIKAIEEIATSENLISKPSYVKKALSLALTAPNQILLQNPFDHILGLINSEHSPNIEQSEFILNEVVKFISLEDDFLNSKTDDPTFVEMVKQWDKGIETSAQSVNNMLPMIRQNIKNGKGKNAHRQLKTEILVMELIANMSEQVIKQNELDINLDWSEFPWNKIQMLITTWDIYFKDLELSGTMKFHKNDWIDILNLFYVQPGTMYWTNEQKWLRIFERSENTRNNVFEQ